MSIRAGTLSVLTQAMTAGIQLLATIVLARLLNPSDFGIVAMAVALTALAGVFRDLGLSTASIQSRAISASQQSTLFLVNLGSGLLLAALVSASGPWLARFYSQPELSKLVIPLACTFIASSIGAQHGAVLRREMRFASIMIASVAGAIAAAGVSISLAAIGFRYWSLAWGTLIGTCVSSMLLVVLSPMRLVRPGQVSEVRSLLGFGGHVTGFELANYAHRNLDSILIGQFIGASALGLYGRAYQMATLPVGLIRNPVAAAAFPALSRLNEQPELFRSYYKRVCGLVAAATMPAAAFLACTSDALVALLLGTQWSDAAPLLSVLAMAGFIQPASGLRGTVVLATGRSSAYMTWGIVNAIALSLSFLVGIRWGAIGVATCYVAMNYLLLIPSQTLAFRETAIRFRDFASAIARPAVASIAAAGALRVLQSATPMEPGWWLPILLAVAFTAFYLGTFAALPGGNRELRYQWSLGCSLLKRPSSPEEI